MYTENQSNNEQRPFDFGLYPLSCKFFEGTKLDKIKDFLKCFGWDKGYLIYPKGGWSTFWEFFTRTFPGNQYQKPIELLMKCTFFQMKGRRDIDIEESAKFEDIKDEPEKYFSNNQFHEKDWQGVLLPMLLPWFLEATRIEFFDPYFNPVLPKWFNPLNSILRTIPNDVQVYYHCTIDVMMKEMFGEEWKKQFYENNIDPTVFVKLKELCDNLRMPSKCNCTINYYKKSKQIHDRFIIFKMKSNRVPKDAEVIISSTYGWDNDNNSNDTDKSKTQISFLNPYYIKDVRNAFSDPLWSINYSNGQWNSADDNEN